MMGQMLARGDGAGRPRAAGAGSAILRGEGK
jgi:hypothetical protein